MVTTSSPHPFSPLTHRVLRSLLPIGLAFAGLSLGWWWLAPAQPALAIDPTFAEKRFFGTGSDVIFDVVSGDMDGDGDLDLVASRASRQHLVFFNDGSGNFHNDSVNCLAPPANVRCVGQASDYGRSLAVGDLNGDGALDIVSGVPGPTIPAGIGFSGGQNYIYLNDGYGNFDWAGSTIPFGTGVDVTLAVALGDVDGDGDLDIAVGNEGRRDLGVQCVDPGGGQYTCPDGEQSAVYLNNGAATYTISRTFGVNTDATSHLHLADIDGDTWLDVVAGHHDSAFGDRRDVVYLNSGTGTFHNSSEVNCAAPPGTVQCIGTGGGRAQAVGDMDGDGDLDVAGSGIAYLNNGSGVFYSSAVNCASPPSTVRCLGSGTDTVLALGDVNGDGALDLAAYKTTNTLILNDGDGDFPATLDVGLNIGLPNAVVFADVNADGALDIIHANFGAQSIIYLNDKGGQLADVSRYRRNFGTGTDLTQAIAVGDVNGDRALDLVTANYAEQGFVYLNTGLGRFPNTITDTRAFGASNHQVGDMVIGDVNGDQALDIVLANNNQPNVVYLNDGLGNFPNTVAYTRTFGNSVSAITHKLTLGDLNGDGALDIVLGLEYRQSAAYLNDGQGNFPDTAVYTRPIGTSQERTRGIAVGDLNGDGALDVIKANTNQFSLIYLNDGAGNFPTTAPYTRSVGVQIHPVTSVAVADFNRDGALDIVLGVSGPDVVYLNDGAGNFDWPGSARYFDFSATNTSHLAVWDVNGDEAPDIITGGSYEPRTIHINDGLGNFPATREFASGDTDDVEVGDINGDGAVDLAVAVFGSQNLVYLNGAFGIARLPNNPPHVALAQPNPGLNANFVYTNPLDRMDIIPFTYTVSDAEGERVNAIRAEYSPDGGGRWFPATATSNTLTTSLATLGGVLGLDGTTDDYVILNPFTSFPTTAATVAFWMKSVDTTNSGTPFSYASTGSTNDLLIFNYRNLDLAIAGQGLTGTTGLAVNDGLWHHLALTWRSSDGQTLLYKDGLPVYTATLAAGLSLTSGGALVLGQDQDSIGGTFQASQAFRGQLDETRVYARVLTPTEIVQLANFQSPSASGLRLYWRFNESRGSTVYDQTSARRDGTIVGSTRGLGEKEYVYWWDTFASGFFGQTDMMLFRLDAYPNFAPTVKNVPGPYQRSYLSAQTFPFRARGTQVRVISNTVPISSAIVYRLPATQTLGALPFSTNAGLAYRTDRQGYLQGRGQLNLGDRLFALLPVYVTDTYGVYYTNISPTLTGADGFNVTTSGVQTISVSSSNPFILFNLAVSLEWDARDDAQYLAQLQFDFERASQILFDASNGQIALGNVDIYHAQGNLANADVRIFATNALRPYATLGGAVTTPTTEIALGQPITYTPGQVILGATWNRYGDPGVRIGEDYARTLAHELAHWMLYQDDDYLGLDANNDLIALDTCTGTLMADAYLDANSEFHPDAQWATKCANTLANQTTGRSDWATLQKFYPWVITPTMLLAQLNPGPSSLPLAVTQVKFIEPVTPTTTLPDPRFYLKDVGGGSLIPGRNASIVLYRGDELIEMGRPIVDQAVARGAQPDDRLCVYDPTGNRAGCKTLTSNDNQELRLTTLSNWQPDVRITLPTSRTVNVQALNLPAGLTLRATLYTGAGVVSQTMNYMGGAYTTTLSTGNFTAGSGQVVLQVLSDPDPNARRELLSGYAIGGNVLVNRNPNQWDRNPNQWDRNPNQWDRNAPVISGDGYLAVYSADVTFPAESYYVVQEATILPSVPAWATPVGKGYWLTASANAPSLSNASLRLTYAQSDVPAGGEQWLKLYRWDGATWTVITTTVEANDNIAIAPAVGPGLYALMASVEIPLYGPGWDLFAYPVAGSQPITDALLSIAGAYSMVYWYDGADTADHWKLYTMEVPTYVVDLYDVRFGEAYWISMTQSAVLRLGLGVGTDISLLPEHLSRTLPDNLPNPPATFYGAVQMEAAQAGMVVQAYINGVPCGQGQTLNVDGQVVYSVNVLADVAGASSCGANGRVVMFRVNGVLMSAAAPWDNNRVWAVDLAPAKQVYLPLIGR